MPAHKPIFIKRLNRFIQAKQFGSQRKLTKTVQKIVDGEIDDKPNPNRNSAWGYNGDSEYNTYAVTLENKPLIHLKEIASDVSYIIFEIEPDLIINADPIVQWNISTINPKQTINFNYSISNIKNQDILIDANNYLNQTVMTDYTIKEPGLDDSDKIVIETATISETLPGKEEKIFCWWCVIILVIIFAIITYYIIKKNKKNKSRKRKKN